MMRFDCHVRENQILKESFFKLSKETLGYGLICGKKVDAGQILTSHSASMKMDKSLPMLL